MTCSRSPRGGVLHELHLIIKLSKHCKNSVISIRSRGGTIARRLAGEGSTHELRRDGGSGASVEVAQQ